MSRIPPPSASSRNVPRTPGKKPSTTSLRGTASTPARKVPPSPTPGSRPSSVLRTQPSVKSLKSTTTVTPRSPTKRTTKPVESAPAPVKAPTLSLREQIALKRAEAKKATPIRNSPNGLSSDSGSLEDAIPPVKVTEDIVDLGRWSIKETIERARSTGAINLASRDLPCIPSALFEIHLGITPEPLKLVPVEPPITTASCDDFSSTRRRNGSENEAAGPTWYEAQDLEVLKAMGNEILEVQPEISMFGSLKSVDLHNNKLTFLPDTFADLTALHTLDLSHNALAALPINLFAMPNLTTLNLSHNALTALPFSLPFSSANANLLARTNDPRGDWYCESITRATVPLPKLVNLDVSNNHITASSVDHEIGQLPAALSKLNMSMNPLGKCVSLLRALAKLEKLVELRCEKADIGDDSFPVDLLSSQSTSAGGLFPSLTLLDLGDTQVTRPAVEAVFLPSVIKQQLEFEVTTQAPSDGTLRVVIGKVIVKEAWEVEAERRVAGRGRGARYAPAASTKPISPTVLAQDWDIEADQGLLTEGAKRRARAAAVAAAANQSPSPTPTSSSAVSTPTVKVVEKEAWEIEAEQGLLTAGGRRRARAAAAAAAALSASTTALEPTSGPVSAASATSSSSTQATSSALAQPEYYTAATQTLTLPPSVPPSKSQHMRSFSHAPTSSQIAQAKANSGLAIPTPTLPLVAILSQSLAHNLKILTLANRRMDPSFSLPSLGSPEGQGPFLPSLEELSLEGCNLSNTVPVSRPADVSGDTAPSRKSEPLLPLLAKLFPSLRTLDLSYNTLKSDAFDKDTLAELILASDSTDSISRAPRKGLRQLRLRGNRITELDGFQSLAEMFKGNREVPTWKLEELDLRDNEIGKLPPEIGMLPLDVFLVDGNVFRMPPRRVWEREGTKGLLSWLRGRIE